MKHIAKYNSAAPAKNWGNFIDNFFNHSLSNVIGSDMTASQPAVNIVETTADFRIELAAPGLEKEDFDIQVEHETLKIEAKKEVDETKTDGNFTRREFNYTSFKRSFHLPENIQIEDISAAYDDGILSIKLPKVVAAEETKPKAIEIS